MTVVNSSERGKDKTHPIRMDKDGDAYIIPANAIEAWQPHTGKIAQWDASNSSWFYITVRKGFSFFVEDVDKHMIYTAAGWKRVAFEP